MMLPALRSTAVPQREASTSNKRKDNIIPITLLKRKLCEVLVDKMEISLSLATWRYALLTQSIIIMFLDVVLISSGVLLFGGAGSVDGAYTATALGLFTLLVCFVGCFTALRDSYKFSRWYIGSALLCIVLQAVFMINFIVIKESMLHSTEQRIEDLWQLEQETPGAMNGVQSQYYCCGKDSPQDYLKDDDDVIPSTCCYMENCESTANIFAKGCASTATQFFKSQSDSLILTFVGLILLEILSLLNAFYFGKSILDNKQQALQEQ